MGNNSGKVQAGSTSGRVKVETGSRDGAKHRAGAGRGVCRDDGIGVGGEGQGSHCQRRDCTALKGGGLKGIGMGIRSHSSEERICAGVGASRFAE